MPAVARPTPGPAPHSNLPPRSLKKNVLFAVGGMGVFHACQFGVIILLAKFAPPDVLGQVRFSLALATPIVLFCSFELRGALVADAAEEFSFGTYRKLRSVMMTLAGIVLAGLAVWEAGSGRGVAFTVIMVGMCASKIILSLADVGWGLFQKRERLDLLAGSAVLRGLAMIAAFALFVPLYWHLHGQGRITLERMPDGAALAITLYVLVSITILVVFDRRRVTARRDHDSRWDWPAVWKLAQQTFPLGMVLLMLHLCNSIPELVIAKQENGKAALGHFGALAIVTLAGNLLIFQTANAAANRLSRAYQTDLRAFLRLAGILLGAAVIVAGITLAVAFPFGQWLLRFLYRADYAVYYPEFRIIIVAQCLALLTNVFGVLATQMRLFWLQVPAQIIVLISTAAAAWVFIPGAENLVRGGAWTLLVRAGVHAALYAACVLAGLLLRSRLLQRRVPIDREPPRPEPGAGDTGRDW